MKKIFETIKKSSKKSYYIFRKYFEKLSFSGIEQS